MRFTLFLTNAIMRLNLAISKFNFPKFIPVTYVCGAKDSFLCCSLFILSSFFTHKPLYRQAVSRYWIYKPKARKQRKNLQNIKNKLRQPTTPPLNLSKYLFAFQKIRKLPFNQFWVFITVKLKVIFSGFKEVNNFKSSL